MPHQITSAIQTRETRDLRGSVAVGDGTGSSTGASARAAPPGGRAFIHLAGAWYGASNLLPTANVVDEIMLGRADADGEFSVEVAMLGWSAAVRIGDRPAVYLHAFDDCWRELAQIPDVLSALASLDGKQPTPQEVILVLQRCGYSDATPREMPAHVRAQTQQQ